MQHEMQIYYYEMLCETHKSYDLVGVKKQMK